MAKIGFVGIGIMGSPMVVNLLKAGHHVQVWNRTPAKLGDLIKLGAQACHEVHQVATDVDFLICMLSDGEACNKILFQDHGAVTQLKQGATVIVMSSIPVETARFQNEKCQALGFNYLDAPVSGGEKGAIQGNLAIMVGGKEAVFEQAKLIFSAMGRSVLVGGAGCGELAKLVNQMIVASTIATVSEGLLLAQQGGADPFKVREALSGGFADSPILQQHGERILHNQFKPGGTAKTQLKDIYTATAYAKSLSLSLPVAELVDQLFENMVNAGDGDLDHSALIRELKRMNHLENSH